MIRLIHDHGYETSRDYELLVGLMKKTAVVCFIDYVWMDGAVTRDVAATIFNSNISGNDVFDISCRGTSYAYTWSASSFIKCCQKYNVEFIIPVVYEQCTDCGARIPSEYFKLHDCGD
ncbi:hypothetical protein UFOVP1419_8 [uncultured Caudovirales phage]|uniref:Uncharacterized protein n=1 Tax=uncultured Caudovirales phage TaxID=2100421 RepID=A0A6J5SCV7_9CAUD|nr:hypothetical protein UFOVP1419_8 [uncultured Caudovirales phage]